ncbi:MAG: T9SS type A sorting domain-containing protein [Sphingobacteriaceae bacterium]|nr:T9SS type A sorting domain-containing protein [Sphingobacteriaceae bacterium]
MKITTKKAGQFLLAFSLTLLSTTSIKAQTSVTYTCDVYVDVNNNLIHDVGEINVNNAYNLVPVRSGSACGGNYSTGTFYGNCPGAKNGGNVQSCSSGTYIAEVYHLGRMIQPGITVSGFNMTGHTSSVTNIPLIPSTLNQAFINYTSLSFRNTNLPFATMYGSTQMGGVTDTATGTLCNNSPIDIKVINNFMIYNMNNCNNLNTIMNFKIDATTIDTYSFTAGATNNYSIIPLSTGSVQLWYSAFTPYQTGMSYSLTNYPAPSPGWHTFSIESVPVGMSYTATTVMKSAFFVNDCGQISGNAFVDCNNNCTKDGAEYYPNYSAVNILLTNATNTIFAQPDANGNFAVNAPIGTYTIVPTAAGGYSICSTPSIATTVTTSSTFTFNVGLRETSIPPTDFSTYFNLTNGNPGPGAVPGGTITINAYNSRYGSACSPLTSPTSFKVVLPPLMSFGAIVGLTPAPSAIISAASGDTIVWNSPAPNGLHQFTAITATNAVIGTQYCIKSIILPLIDGNPTNNTYNFCANYGGPYDPNDKKSEAPGMALNGDILPSTTDLVYTIRFQNLGTGKAVNVNIKDTINTNLDLSSFQILTSSFPVQAQINAVNNIVDFKFANINLPAAVTNEPGSHGYVRYKINLKPSLPLGTIITNRAHIYFDYNAPVATNKTINTIVLAAGINEIEKSSFINLYPNPTNGSITINSIENLKSVQVYNVTGALMINVSDVNSKSITVDLHSFAKGLYFVKTETKDGKSMTKKVILE